MSTDDELRALRERAYGPTADIHEDPAALARLHALEEERAHRDAAPPAPAGIELDTEADIEAGIDADAAPDDPLPRDTVEAEQEPTEPPDAHDGPTSTRRLARRTVWLWAGSIVAALILGAAIWMATSAIVADRVAVLPEVDVTEWPTSMFGDPQEGARVFDAFEGIRVLVVPNAWGSPGADITCLFVVRAADEDGSATNEILTTGCGSEAFAPTASFTVTDASPAGLRDRFPAGTGIRVVVEGDEAQVFARTP